MFDIQHSTFKFWTSKIEYQTKSNIQIECRISNIKLQSHIQILNVEYRISNWISHSNRISNIKHNLTFKVWMWDWVWYLIFDIQNLNVECWILNIEPIFDCSVATGLLNFKLHFFCYPIRNELTWISFYGNKQFSFWSLFLDKFYSDLDKSINNILQLNCKILERPIECKR